MQQANFAVVLVWSSVLSLNALAQQSNTGTPPKPKPPGTTKPAATSAKPQPKENAVKEAEPELTPQQQRALGLVREAGQEAGGLDDKRSAAQIQAKAADLLWPHDAALAKELFAKSFETGLAHYRDTADDNLRKVGRNATVSRPDVLLDVIRLVNKHDSELGRSYTEKYVEEKKRQREAQQNKPVNPALDRLLGDNQAAAAGLWRVADSLLEAETKLSYEVAGRALALAVTPETAFYLAKLAGKDRKLADQLYARAVNRLRADPAPLPGHLQVLTAYPFGSNSVRLLNGQDSHGYGFGGTREFTVDPQVVRLFLTTAYAVLTRVAEPAMAQLPDGATRLNTAFYVARSLEPKVAEFQPALLDEWRALALRLSTAVADKTRQSLETQAQRDSAPQEKQAPRNPQEDLQNALTRAEQATDPSQRDTLYARAAQVANDAGETERALEIAGKINDLPLRIKLKSWINYGAADRASRDKKWDDARRYALEVEATEERAYLLFQIATALLKEKDTPRASAMLEEAYQQATAAENSPRKVKALLGIANVFAASDFVRGFEVAEAAVKAANQLQRDKTGLAPDDTALTRVLEIGGSTMTNTNNVEGFDLGRTLANLAKHDLERALSLLRGLDHLALRYTATVTVAESLLKQTAK